MLASTDISCHRVSVCPFVTSQCCTAAKDVVSVSTSRSRDSRDVVSKRLGLVEKWEGLGLV